MQKCIVVLGMHRSGTSALMGVLNILGVDLGSNLLNPSEDNPKGFFENNNIFQLNEKILESFISSWDDVFSLPENRWNYKSLELYKKEIIEIIKTELRGEIFGIKDPRMCKFVPFWNNIFEELSIKPYYIIMVRNPLEVANSLKKRNGFSIEKSTLLWMNYMIDAETYSRNYPRVFVSFDELLKIPEKTIDKISKVLNINFPKLYSDVKTDIEAFLDPNLRHHNFRMGDVNEDLLELIFDYYNVLLCISRDNKINKEELSRINEMRNTFFKICKHFYNEDIRSNIRQLDSILSSRGWKFLLKSYKIRDKFLPFQTRRRQMVRFFLMQFKTCLNSCKVACFVSRILLR